jgi:hypothetical protein
MTSPNKKNAERIWITSLKYCHGTWADHFYKNPLGQIKVVMTYDRTRTFKGRTIIIIIIIIIIISFIIIYILTILSNNCQTIFLLFRIDKNTTLLPLF